MLYAYRPKVPKNKTVGSCKNNCLRFLSITLFANTYINCAITVSLHALLGRLK